MRKRSVKGAEEAVSEELPRSKSLSATSVHRLTRAHPTCCAINCKDLLKRARKHS